jgi:hypothetical protein
VRRWQIILRFRASRSWVRVGLVAGKREIRAMLAFGISTVEQYARATRKRRLNGSAISYGLLRVDQLLGKAALTDSR